jgi:pyridoxal phosphate enzyme (YggS family)
MSISENIAHLREEIRETAEKAGRNPEEIRVIAATKDVPVSLIKEALNCGIKDIGENRVQEAAGKFESLKKEFPDVTWHMIGHLQTNKVNKALRMFSFFQSVDNLHLAEFLNERAQEPVEILLEINTSGEQTKYGILPGNAVELCRQVAKLSNPKIKGLMTIAEFTDDRNISRKNFRVLKEIKEKIQQEKIPNVQMKYLSMGMTSDFKIAIEEGSNMIRVGTGIFGIEHRRI